ncbi:MATE family efflux transporter [Mesorhizobium sp. CAU 1732]|uniref:MATE family efflux transporter n=1 Tax=Mesorhizobium sp. CAU 1732 TaxID=3140358 RepID=UPI003261D27C
MTAAPIPSNQAKFVTGSTMRHVSVMTATGSVGLVAIFFVDALNLFYISMLGIQELAAAIGFASTLLFFTVSISIGFTIAASALVSRALGRGDRTEAARLGGASMLFIGSATTAVAVLAWPFLDTLVGLLGATGETRALSTRFMQIVIPSLPIMALGMCTTGILRGVGDARRAMYVTLAGGIAAAVLDPLFIFGFGLGLDGAAISTVLSRLVLLAVGLHGAHYVHGLIALPSRETLVSVARPFMAIGIPAVLTQVATPVGNAYVTYEMSRFGDEAIAGWAIVGRLIPVAFGVIFALSGSVGPILGQNYGARRYDRLNQVMRDSLIFVTVYCLAAWLVLALLSSQIAGLFGAVGAARELIVFFCLFAAGSFLFNGALFVANAAFNNLGFPTLSTLFNWGRSTLGVIPFVWIGAHYYGAKGVVAGWGLGAIVFGIVSLVVAFRVVRNIGVNPPPEIDLDAPPPPPAAQSPFSTGKAATLQ